jgi:uncharacterized OB-fold protein
MPEVEVQEPVCGKCGAEVRPDTAFCYNCGASVTGEAEASPNGQLVVENRESVVTNGASAKLEDRRPSPPKYESAAGLRRRSRLESRKPVEVTWEPETESVNLTFVIASICLLVVAIILIVAAMYLK